MAGEVLVQVKAENKFIKFVKTNALLISILVAIVVGFGIGLLLKNTSWNNTDNVLWFTLPGNLFIRALELLILPVIFVGVISATSSLSAKSNLKITLVSVGLILLTHILATICALIGSIILTSISKASENENDANAENEKQKTTYDIISDILRSLIPKNIIKASTNQELTKYISKVVNGTIVYERKVEYIEGTNILGVLVFAILLGLAASVLDKKAEPFREFFKSTNEIVILVLRWLILFAPVGIASLIIEAILGVDDLAESFKKIGVFAGLCIGVLLFYGTVVLGLLIFIFTRQLPFKFYGYFFEPMLLAFASTSGAVCMHKSLEICEEKCKMDNRISRFTIPFYTTLQADGSSIFIVMAASFLADYANTPLTAGDYAVVIIMTCILCLCLPSVPSSSIVTILVVLNAVNINNLNIAILYTVEWLLDRIRTAVNLYSHCFCAYITHELCIKGFNEATLNESREETKESLNENFIDSSSTQLNTTTV